MTEQAVLTLIWMSSLIAVAALAFMFASANGTSNFQSLVAAWEKKRLAEIELKKIQAQHERVCPRLTDTPRKS